MPKHPGSSHNPRRRKGGKRKDSNTTPVKAVNRFRRAQSAPEDRPALQPRR